MDAPQFLRIEGHLGLVLHLSAQVGEARGITFLGKAARDGLRADFDFQILGNYATDYHKESSDAHIRVGPDGDSAGPDLAVHDDGKRRTVVREKRQAGGQQQEHGKMPVSGPHGSYPINVARISIGWDISHSAPAQRSRQMAAQGRNARTG